MYNFFPLFRGALLGTVAAWTFIVLGIAIHFQMSFVDSAPQLTYVSLAVFVAAVTLALFLVVLVAPCNRKVSNILRTKWELAWLGVLAILWTALAGYTTSPAAKDNEVECWDEDEDGVVVEADVQGYSNDVYHARYRVLQGFAFFNCILLLFLFLFILALAFWHHKRGRYVIWTTPTTSVGWFDGPTGKGTGKHLPPPITHRKSNKDKEYEEWDNEKEMGSGRKRGFKFDHSSISEKVRDTVKDKIGKRYKDTDDYDEILAKRDLIQKPPAVARANTAPLKPKQYVVGVPAGGSDSKSKPSLPPIATKMAAQREREASEPRRQPSQREKADKAYQEARRERNNHNTDDERPSRPAVRQNNATNVQVKRSGSTPAGIAIGDSSSKSRPAVAKRDQSVPRTTEPRRQPSQTRGGGGAPDVVRSGSGAGNGGRAKASANANANANLSSSQPQIHRNNSSRRNESGTDQRANKSSEEEGRYKSNNPYKTSGRRI